MSQASVSNDGRSCFKTIGQLNNCKRVFNEVSLTPWCHAVVHFEVEMSLFWLVFQGNRPESSG